MFDSSVRGEAVAGQTGITAIDHHKRLFGNPAAGAASAQGSLEATPRLPVKNTVKLTLSFVNDIEGGFCSSAEAVEAG
jgi:hypothetical protein